MIYSNFYAIIYDAWVAARSSYLAIFKQRGFFRYLIIFLILHLLVWLESGLIYRQLGGELLVLHYNVDFGIDLVASPGRIFVYPFFSLLVLVINLSLAAVYNHQRQTRIYTGLLLSGAILFTGFFNLYLIFVYLINFR